jgi:hypothetical protein
MRQRPVDASVSPVERQTTEMDEDEASADPRSALTSLMLPPKGSGATGAIEFHAKEPSSLECSYARSPGVATARARDTAQQRWGNETWRSCDRSTSV